MEYVFYPGCALDSSSTHYAKSAKAVCDAVDVPLVDLEDWSCCGATAYIGTDEDKAVAYSARNLALAEAAGAANLVAACSGCYLMLRKANKCFNSGPEIREHVESALEAAGLHYSGGVNVRHVADVLHKDVGTDKLTQNLKASLEGLKVAAYHGCQISRPFDDLHSAERPTVLDELLATTEAEVVHFPLTAKCCGGMLMQTRSEVALPLVHDLLSCAKAAGADCVAVACPLCSVNLECYQDKIAREFDWPEPMPVVLFTQLLGIAVGVPSEELGLEQCYVDVEPVLARYV